MGLSIYLETNGTLLEGLERIVDEVDLIAMDIKELCDGAAIDRFWPFLQIARHRKVFVKSVVRPAPNPAHYRQLAEGVQRIAPEVPIVLQPVTPYGAVASTPSPEEILGLQADLKKIHPQVRVVPQTHQFIGQR